MKIKNHVPLSRLIGKIDNDFNISESDWIPRVAAWVIDALSQMNILPKELKRRTLEVSDRIAQFPCQLDASYIKILDTNGCEIPNINDVNSCACNKSKTFTPQEIAVYNDKDGSGVNFMEVATVVGSNSTNRNYVLDCNNIELNFDTDFITVESYEVATYYDDYYECDVPYIYDNGLLLEALAHWCLYKYLSRGSKHQVFDLKSNNPATNPYLQWLQLKPKASNSVKKELSVHKENEWNNFFYNSTFRPRS